MSKKLVSLVLAVMMLATVALAEGIVSKTVITQVAVLSTTGDVKTEKIDEETAAVEVAAAVEALTQLSEGTVTLSEAAQAKVAELSYDLAKVDLTKAIITEPVKMTLTEPSKIEYAKDPTLAGYAKIAALALIGEELWPFETEVNEDSVNVIFDEEDVALVNGQNVTMTFAGVEE